MSLWDWLLAAWIYEELFDDDLDNSSHDNTRDYDSPYDYDDYEEELFDDDSNDSSYNNTHDRDSSYDYDDFEEDF